MVASFFGSLETQFSRGIHIGYDPFLIHGHLAVSQVSRELQIRLLPFTGD